MSPSTARASRASCLTAAIPEPKRTYQSTTRCRSMIRPIHTAQLTPSGLSLDDFVGDRPWSEAVQVGPPRASPIEGVSVTPLPVHSDDRGALSELLTTRDGPIEPIEI